MNVDRSYCVLLSEADKKSIIYDKDNCSDEQLLEIIEGLLLDAFLLGLDEQKTGERTSEK
jgi:hypothetical protein